MKQLPSALTLYLQFITSFYLVYPFVPNAPFFYPLKTSENSKVFWCFQGVEKECIKLLRMGSLTLLCRVGRLLVDNFPIVGSLKVTSMQEEGEKLYNESERKGRGVTYIWEKKIYFVFYLMKNRLYRINALTMVRNKFC